MWKIIVMIAAPTSRALETIIVMLITWRCLTLILNLAPSNLWFLNSAVSLYWAPAGTIHYTSTAIVVLIVLATRIILFRYYIRLTRA